MTAPSPGQEARLAHDGIRVGEIIAWRTWLTRPNSLHLSSVSVCYEWPILGPAKGNVRRFGIHAFKDRDQAVSYWLAHWYYIPTVLGMVKLWGEIVECEWGYRAQFARVKSLDLIYPMPSLCLDRLRRAYLGARP